MHNEKIKEENRNSSSLRFNMNKEKSCAASDLKYLIALCETDKNLIGDTISLSKTYFAQDNGHQKMFHFGPVLMRLFYIHDAVDEALQLVLHEEYGKYFDETSYKILMDKLFKIGRYKEVKLLMDKLLHEKRLRNPVACILLALAANYKIGTGNALEDSLKLFLIVRNYNRLHYCLRPAAFTAAQAINLERARLALAILALCDWKTNSLICNLTILATSKLGNIDESLLLLRTIILCKVPKYSKFKHFKLFYNNVIEELEASVYQTMEFEKVSEFLHYKRLLENLKLISSESLDQSLCRPVKRYNFMLDAERYKAKLVR